MACSWMMYNFAGMAQQEIGKFLNREVNTVSYHCHTVDDAMATRNSLHSLVSTTLAHYGIEEEMR